MGQAIIAQREPLPRTDPAAMAALVMPFAPASDAEALKLLRASFPHCPLSARVAALKLLMQHGQRRFYSPR